VGQIDAETYPFPTPPTESTIAGNRIMTEDIGVYAQGRYTITPSQTAHLGLRFDHHSRYGTIPTIRAGWVGTFGSFGVKALYGEAFQEPVPRLLYGGWRGSGSDPNLDPERARTVEVSGSVTKKSVSALVSGWWVGSRDTIVNTAQGAMNLGDRSMIGLDLSGQVIVPVAAPFSFRVWGWWSHLFSARETKLDAQGNELGEAFIGDLARDKLFLGVTGSWREKVTATLRARFVSRRDTVWTNPVGSVGSYASLDANLQVRDLGVRGLGVAVKLTNALDETILQPGVRDASAGTTPGAFDAEGVWHGSAGFFSSLLPQPGRILSVTALLDF
jgi:iron complex outermembrane receptor protein